MSDGFVTSAQTMGGIVGALRSGAADLEAAGTSAPSSVDAGAKSPDILDFVGTLTKAAADLLDRVTAAADAVATANVIYQRTDQNGANAMRTSGRGGARVD